MTANSDDRSGGSSLPRDANVQKTTESKSVSDGGELEHLTQDKAAEADLTASSAALGATTQMSPRQFGEINRQAVAPQIGAITERIGEFVAGGEYNDVLESGAAPGRTLSELVSSSAYQSMLRSTALAPTKALSVFAEVLGQSTADRAAFSLASGLRGSDLVTSTIGKLMVDTEGLGIATSALAILGESLKGFTDANVGLTTSSALAVFSNGLGRTIDVSSISGALGQFEAVRSIINGLAGPEITRSRSVAMQQLVASSGIADLIGSDKFVASWRQSLLSEATARSLIGTMALPESGASLLRDIVAANTATARVVGRYAELNGASIIAPVISARPTRELRSFLAGMPVAPDLDELTFAVRASRSVAGIAAGDLLLGDGTIDDEASEEFEAEIVEPWLNGPEALRSWLFIRLGGLDAHIPDLLRGAWAQVEQDGPAATSMASHAVQEAMDRTLHALGPADLVLRLHAAGHIPKNSVYEKNGERHPTRTGRIATALHKHQIGESKLIAAQTKALAASVGYLTESLQAGKHASTGTVGLVRTWLVSVEATLTQLLYEPGDG